MFPLIVGVILIYVDKSVSAAKQPQPAAVSAPSSQVTESYVRKISPPEANSTKASLEAVLGAPTNKDRPAQRVDFARPAAPSTPDRVILQPVQPVQLDF